ncbi:MAG: trigger factor [Candidatus Acidiferrales bacterium]
MTEATCKREIELEIPAENVQKAEEKVARDIARVARVPGFRPGKAPVTLIRRRFAEDIRGEVMQSLVPEYLEKALDEKKLVPVTRPEVEKLEFKEGEPLKFRATFEVLPEFELGDYKNLEVKVEAVEVGDTQVDKTIDEVRDRMATFVPIEGREAKDQDYAIVKLIGTPVGGGDPVQADGVLCHIGGEETLEAFTENLRGVNPGEMKRFRAEYPKDYPDPKLAGKAYDYTIEVQGLKEKKLPEVNDEFAKDVASQSQQFSGVTNVAELRQKIRADLDAAKDEQQASQAREKILELLVQRHDFPVPEALVESQMDTRLERVVRSLVAQGVDPRAVNVDWVSLRKRQQERALSDVKAELILDRIATAENVDATDEDVDKEIAKLAERSDESATAIRARLTKQGAVARMKSKLRSDKAIDLLYRTARVETVAKSES